MIIYYVIFASSNNGVAIAMLSFGINSGAYVAEIIRGGIMRAYCARKRSRL